MRGPFASLFPKKPNSYLIELYATCSKTEYYSAYIKTDEQLFSNEKTKMPPEMYYVFNYEYDEKQYSFKILSKGNAEYELFEKHRIYIKPSTPEKIWFEYKEMLGFQLK